MNIKDTIKQIHDSDIYGFFIETGCGVALTNKLMSIAGASKTIFMAECPYNKDMMQTKYGKTDRAVSIKTVENILDYYKELTSNLNTIYAASFQIGDETNEISTHGYIGISYKGNAMIHHVSIHDAMTREEYLDVIGNIGVRILDSAAEFIPADCYIDQSYNMSKGNHPNPVKPVDMFQMLNLSETENFLSIDEDGKLCRLEDFFRSQKEIIIYKGSFDPPHIGHIEFAETIKKKYGRAPVFMISMHIYQKDNLSATIMAERVAMLNHLGFKVIVSQKGYFNENITYLRKKFKEKPIIFVVGTDTINRIFESTYKVIGSTNPWPYINLFKHEFENTKFHVIERPGFPLAEELKKIEEYYYYETSGVKISSTMIRKLKAEGKHEEVKKLIPAAIHEKYLK